MRSSYALGLLVLLAISSVACSYVVGIEQATPPTIEPPSPTPTAAQPHTIVPPPPVLVPGTTPAPDDNSTPKGPQAFPEHLFQQPRAGMPSPAFPDHLFKRPAPAVFPDAAFARPAAGPAFPDHLFKQPMQFGGRQPQQQSLPSDFPDAHFRAAEAAKAQAKQQPQFPDALFQQAAPQQQQQQSQFPDAQLAQAVVARRKLQDQVDRMSFPEAAFQRPATTVAATDAASPSPVFPDHLFKRPAASPAFPDHLFQRPMPQQFPEHLFRPSINAAPATVAAGRRSTTPFGRLVSKIAERFRLTDADANEDTTSDVQVPPGPVKKPDYSRTGP